MANPTISSYTTSYNCYQMNYPIELCLQSLLGFSDEVVVVDAGSTDGTIELLSQMARQDSRIKFSVEPVDFTHRRWAIHMDGYLKASARSKCTSEFCWQTDTDEVVVPHDYEKIRKLPELFKNCWDERPVIYLPMIEFWGSLDLIRADFLSWKPRFSKNLANITHGIPLEYKMVDPYGHPYPRPFVSDSCNYMWKGLEESVPMLFPIRLEKTDMTGPEFDKFIHDSVDLFPSVLHVSWLNLRRKIIHYRTLWTRFYESMYNLDNTDNPEWNDMFDKSWKDVTDQDIEEKARELEKNGPRFFQKKMNKNHGAMIPYRGYIPDSLRAWVQSSWNYAPTKITGFGLSL